MVDYDLRPCDHHINITDSSFSELSLKRVDFHDYCNTQLCKQRRLVGKRIFAFKAMLGTYNNLRSLKAVNCEA